VLVGAQCGGNGAEVAALQRLLGGDPVRPDGVATIRPLPYWSPILFRLRIATCQSTLAKSDMSGQPTQMAALHVAEMLARKAAAELPMPA
jgi:hypothetical protein